MSAVEVRGVDLDVPDRRILHGVDMEVQRGEIVAVVGMSGSGKTTLLKCIAALIKPSRGSILIDGEDIVPLPEHRLDRVRLRIGLVFQYAALFDSLTVEENVGFGVVYHGRATRAEASRLVAERLKEVGMAGSERLYPSQLSGGMQKRVGLARALALEPSLILYDEPTSGLDPVIGRTIDDLIVRTRDRTGVSSIVVSHDILSIFRIADRIVMLEQGRILTQGTPAELRQSPLEAVQEFVRQD